MRWLKQAMVKSKYIYFYMSNLTFCTYMACHITEENLNLSLVYLFPKEKKRKENIFFSLLVFPLQLLPGMYCSKPFVTFHQINAFEDQGCVVIDLCCQDNGRNLEVYQLQNLRKAGEELDQVNIFDFQVSSK